MIKIEKTGAAVILKFFRKSIIFHDLEYSYFQQELFALEGDKRTQIKDKDLTFVDYHLLFHKHIPKYNNVDQRKLDIEPLLAKYNWSCLENYSPE